MTTPERVRARPPVHDLAVIIVSMADTGWLRPCLATLLERTGPLRVEVVVVENGPIEPTAELLASEFPSVRLIDSPNHGFAAANNLGLERCDARYVLFLNPDTEIVAGTMGELVAALDARPEVGLAGVRHLTGGRLYPSMRRFGRAGFPSGCSRWTSTRGRPTATGPSGPS